MSQSNAMTATLLIEIPKRMPGVRVWRNNRLDAVVSGAGGRMRRVKAGVNGQADITGILPPNGRRLEVEIKAGKDKQSVDQVNFQMMCLETGAAYFICRDVEVTLGELAVIYRGEGNVTEEDCLASTEFDGVRVALPEVFGKPNNLRVK